jgi:hypothetical protein
MFFHVTLHRIQAERVCDHPMDPFDTSIELFQTWHLAALDTFADNAPASWARQGCSSRGAPDDGTTLRNGDQVVVVDPQITIGVPDDITKLTGCHQYRLDFHHWEADPGDATEKIRAAFTDATLKYMVDAWRSAKEDAVKARGALEAWVKQNWKDAVKAIAVATAPTSPWTQIGLNILPLVELLVGMLQEQGDDYYGMHRFVIQYRANGANSLNWQITDHGGAPSGWLNGQGWTDVVCRLEDKARNNRFNMTYRFRLVGDS